MSQNSKDEDKVERVLKKIIDNTFEQELPEESYEEPFDFIEKLKQWDFFSESEEFAELSISIGETGTGSKGFIKELKIIEYPFDKYLVKVGLSPENEFLGIIEINVNKDFRSYSEKFKAEDYHNLEELKFED